LNKTLETSNIVLGDFDPTSEWVLESQAPIFDNEDFSWLDLDPPPHDAKADISQAPVATSGPGKSSHNPIAYLDATHSSHEEEEDDQFLVHKVFRFDDRFGSDNIAQCMT